MPYRFAFLIEQTLGHVTHAQNLAAGVARDASIEPAWLPVHYRCDDRVARIPLVRRSWTLKLSLRARKQLRECGGASRFDAVFFHTQVIAHASLDLMSKVPAVVSLDATPVGRAAVEAETLDAAPPSRSRLARLWTARVFRRAAAVVTWSRWAAQSVARDYGVDAATNRIIPPGVDLQAWRPRAEPRGGGELPRLLFVGGEFARKGGPALVEALTDDLGRTCELDVVTASRDVPVRPGLRVHRGLKPNTPALRDLASRCDLFVLPTSKDFTPLAVLEAMACGVPVISTRVGGIAEQVEDGVTGLLVAPNDPAALASAVRSLLSDPARRQGMGRAGRARAERLFCADRNTTMLTGLMKQLADERRQLAHGDAARSPRDPDAAPVGP